VIIRNAIKSLGFDVVDILQPEDIAAASAIIFPGVGSFGQAMQVFFLSIHRHLIPIIPRTCYNQMLMHECVNMQLFSPHDMSEPILFNESYFTLVVPHLSHSCTT